MVRNGWLQATGTQIPVPTRTIISVHYQLQTACWFFLCYLILSIPGPDPIKIPSSICITGTHPNLNKSLFAGLTRPACCRGLCLLQVGLVYLFSSQVSYDISIGVSAGVSMDISISLLSSHPKTLCASTMLFYLKSMHPTHSWISLGNEDKRALR